MLKLEKLKFYRSEVKHEFELLSSRLNSYILSQSFLVTAFAISMGNPGWGGTFRLTFPLILSTLGLATSVRTYPGIYGACKVISLWHVKQRMLLEEPGMKEFYIERPLEPSKLPGSEQVDKIHERSLSFAKLAPWLFGINWIILAALTLYLHFR